MNLAIRGIDANLRKEHAHTFHAWSPNCANSRLKR